MTLPGVSPGDPNPVTRRQIILGAGASGGTGGELLVLIYGNKTSAGSETVETINDPIADDADMIARFGARSEARWLYWALRQADSEAPVYVCAPAEAGGGTAATCTVTFGTLNSDIATTQSTVNVNWAGRSTSFVVNVGDTTAAQCANFVTAIQNADGGSWPMTTVQGSSSSTNVATVSAANIGDRGTFSLTPLQVVAVTSTGNTITKSAVSNGSGTDDFTNAYAAAATAGEYFYQVSAKTSTTTVTATDNGIGEHLSNIATQGNPTNGKGQTAYFGLIGTNAQAITTCTSSGANNAYGFFFWQKNAVWLPGMLAAYHAGIIRTAQIEHPGANLTNYTNTVDTPYIVPPAYSKSDYASSTEITAALNNGFCPIRFDSRGNPSLVRQVTSRSLNAAGASDYKVREGHIPSVMEFTWRLFLSRWNGTKQPFIDDDLAVGQRPRPKTTYPSSVKAMANGIVDDLTSGRPLGIYEGPILSPSATALMKASFSVLHTNAGGGGIEFSGEFRAVEHLIKAAFKLYETSPEQ